MPKTSKQRWNFTLVELMVAMAILVIMMGFLFQFVNGARRIWTASASTAEAFDDAQIVLQVMENDLKHLIQHCEYDYGAKTLCLKYIDEGDTEKYLIFPIGQDASGDPAIIIYGYDNGELFRQQLSLPANDSVFDIFHIRDGEDSNDYKDRLKSFFVKSSLVCDGIQKLDITPFFPISSPIEPDIYTSKANCTAIKISLSLSAGTFVAGQDDESTREFSKFVFLL